MLVYFHAENLSVLFMVCSVTHCLPFLNMLVMFDCLGGPHDEDCGVCVACRYQ